VQPLEVQRLAVRVRWREAQRLEVRRVPVRWREVPRRAVR
jgi:hypothetical protein